MPGAVGLLSARVLTRLAALPIAGTVGYGLFLYPFAQVLLGLALLAHALVGLWRPQLMLVLLPLWLTLVNLAPWSGSVFLEDYDLVMGATLAVFLARGLYAFNIRLTALEWLFLILLTLSYSISFARGFLPFPGFDYAELANYRSHWNAARIAKGFFWSLLLLPAVVALFRWRFEASRSALVWGLALSGGAIGIVAMWERGVFEVLAGNPNRYSLINTLFDFTTPYRITGLFSEMHTGGETIDGFIALVWPFGLLAASRARSIPGRILGGLCAAGALYAAMATFSRVSYLAVAVGALTGLFILFKAGREANPDRPPMGHGGYPDSLAVIPLLALAGYGYTQGGGYVLASTMLSWLMAFAMTAFVFSTRRPPWLARLLWLALPPLTAASAVGSAQGMLTSKWVVNTPGFAWGTGGALAIASVAIGTLMGRRLASRLNWRATLAGGAMLVLGAAIVTPAVLGTRMAARTESSIQDMGVRLNHWYHALSMMRPDISTMLLGMGVGRFPETYFWDATEPMSSFRIAKDAGTGNRFLTLGGGEDQVFTQRVSLPPLEDFTLSMDVRAKGEPFTLGARILRRHIVVPSAWNPRTVNLDQRVGDTAGQWVRLSIPFNSGVLGDGVIPGRHPLQLALAIPRNTLMDVDNVSIRDGRGQEYLANGDFSRGAMRWFPYYDFNHLPWHVKNLWINLYFDQGVLGVVAFAGFLFTVTLAGARRAMRGDHWGVALVTSMTGILSVGLFGSMLDMPRITFICYFMLLVTALFGPPRTLGRRKRRAIGSPP